MGEVVVRWRVATKIKLPTHAKASFLAFVHLRALHPEAKRVFLKGGRTIASFKINLKKVFIMYYYYLVWVSVENRLK
jgi:hypothetical protein